MDDEASELHDLIGGYFEMLPNRIPDHVLWVDEDGKRKEDLRHFMILPIYEPLAGIGIVTCSEPPDITGATITIEALKEIVLWQVA